jgi:hypothetical protein
MREIVGLLPAPPEGRVLPTPLHGVVAGARTKVTGEALPAPVFSLGKRIAVAC